MEFFESIFNAFPEHVLNMGSNVTLFDQSNDENVIKRFRELCDSRIIFVAKLKVTIF